MRFVWLAFVVLIAAMLIVLPRWQPQPAAPVAPPALPVQPASELLPAAPAPPRLTARADSIVAFGLAQQGTPYVYAGTSPLTGFDCSGFIMYTFAHFGVAVPHSTALLIEVGQPVARTDAQPGDIVVFTGTAKTSTTPGHAGIVISRRGEVPLRFVHASSSRREPFVKVNQVENSDYERRFMQVRRVLEPGAQATSRPRVPVPASLNAPVAKLPARRVAVAPGALPARLPGKLALKKPIRNPARKPATASASRRKATTLPKKASRPRGKTTYKPARVATKKRVHH